MAPAAAEDSAWILRPPRGAATAGAPLPPRLTLLCIPHAGSGAHVFCDWQRRADAAFLPVEVVPVELPGRGARLREARHESVAALVDALLAALAPLLGCRPFALLGHSLGGWIAYAAAAELARRGPPAPQPAALIVSGVRSATLAGAAHDLDATRLAGLPPTAFWAAMERRYGRNPELQDPGVRALVFPVLQADFRIAEGYLPAPGTPRLACRVAAAGGASDPRFSAAQIEAWAACAPAAPGGFACRLFPGGHFYLFRREESVDAFWDFLAGELRGALAALEAEPALPAAVEADLASKLLPPKAPSAAAPKTAAMDRAASAAGARALPPPPRRGCCVAFTFYRH
jgi:surfactin synthase thioesterase subunit